MKNFMLTNIVLIFIFLITTANHVVPQIIIDTNATVEEIVTDIEQPEGPVWKEGIGLLFSDIKGNKIYRWTPENGKEIYLDPSDSTNGLTYDLEGRLVAGQMGKRRIVRFENDGTQTPLADRYEGKRFNSPNDLVVRSDGSIFFTDPDFNIPGGLRNKELTFNGIYRISPQGNVRLLDKLELPNGICFSPDEKKLYVNDSRVHKIYVWDVVDDSIITNKKLFFTIPVNGYADGMKVDENGNLYVTCSSFVWIISPGAELIGKIHLPSNISASNCTWGEDDNKTLFITAGHSVFKVRPIITSNENNGQSIPKEYELFQNFPNPFNPSTKISYVIPVDSHVTIKLYDDMGREVVTLENSKKPAGTHTLIFNAKRLPSGVYYYKLIAEDYTASKKLLLLK
ncbi:SMP-30/gluconolactonase/LRE family protein [Melioribacter sp. OK-6-Me]|uniref:SMP-30/gluconolactonase/LRE family protein n=1 Tax=unclassified Melioribacter TaxID=2627329 RepID=UPI003EDA6C29